MESPLRFQAAVAAVAITGAVLLARDRPRVEVAFAFQDKAILESSGLVMTGGTVLTINDSGEEDAVVYVVNARTGQTVGHTTYSTDRVADVEAVTEGPGGSIWVGDIGDNGAERDHVSVYELQPVEAGEHTVTSRRYDLVYSDGPRDAETLLVDPRTGRLHVVSKGLLGGRIYEAPPTLRTDRPNVLRPVGQAGGLATDGAYFPDGRHVLVRSYTGATVYDTDTWESLAGMKLPVQRQGEGLAMTPGGERVLLSSEGANSEVLSVALSKKVLAAVAATPQDQTGSATSAPDADQGSAGGKRWLVLGALTVGVVSGALVLRALVRRLRGSRRRSRSTR